MVNNRSNTLTSGIDKCTFQRERVMTKKKKKESNLNKKDTITLKNIHNSALTFTR